MANPKGNVATLKSYTPAWKSGKTQTIRVPIALADQILSYARQIDNNDSSVTTAQETSLSETLSQVVEVLEKVCETPHTSKFTKALNAKLRAEVIQPLKHLLQVNEDV